MRENDDNDKCISSCIYIILAIIITIGDLDIYILFDVRYSLSSILVAVVGGSASQFFILFYPLYPYKYIVYLVSCHFIPFPI